MNPKQLIKAVENRRAVAGFHTSIESRIPAAYIVSMPFRFVMRVLPRLKLYKPKKPNQPKHHESN